MFIQGPGGTAIAPTTGGFRIGFVPSAPAASDTNELDFGGSGVVGYTATNDIGVATLGLNLLVFNSSSTATNVIAANAAANTLTFNGTTPAINQLGTGGFNVTAGLVTATPVTIGGAGSGPITVAGSVSITTGGQLVLNNPNATLSFAGNLTLNGGANALNTGGITANAGVINFLGSSNYSSATTLNFPNLQVGGANGRAVLNVNTTGQYNFNTPDVGGVSFPTGGSNNPTGATAAGAINLTAGSFNYSNGGANSNFLSIGAGDATGTGHTGGYGSVVVSGGTMFAANANGGGIRVGAVGNGVLTQTGGLISVARYFALGTYGTGVATFTGGNFNSSTAYPVLIGDTAGTGTINIGTEAGGTAVFLSQDATQQSPGGVAVTGMLLGETAASSGILNLNSGTLVVKAGLIIRGPGSAAINLNGGALQAGGNVTLINSLLSGSTKIYRGGAVFDSQTFRTTVEPGLINAAGNGIYPAGGTIAVPAAGSGTGYIGAPVVAVSGGSGSGATAVANMSNGVITGVTLTCPGENYVAGDVVTFGFSGGGATSPVAGYSYTLTAADVAANSTGGLLKTGSGTVILYGANTYSGMTNVAAGVLQPFDPSAFAGFNVPGSLNVAAGATFAVFAGTQFSTDMIVRIIQTQTFAPGASIGLNPSDLYTFDYALTGTIGLTKLGNGKLFLTQPASYSGGTNIAGGVVNFAPGTLGTGSLLVNGGTLQLPTGSPSDPTAGRNMSIGTLGGTIDLNGNTATFANGFTAVGPTYVNGGLVVLQGQFSSTATAATVIVDYDATVVLNTPTSAITAAGEIWVGYVTTAGTLNVSNGGTVSGTNFIAVGRSDGTGVLNLADGGAVNLVATAGNTAVFVTLGAVSNAAKGVVNQTGGTFGNSARNTIIGESGIGVYNMSGGTTNFGQVVLGRNATASGSLNLTGGVFSPTSLFRGAGQATLTFNGGTLRANNSFASSLITGITTTIQSGGATLDTNGQSVSVGARIVGPGALSKVGIGTLTVSNPANNYSGGTNVAGGAVAVSATGGLGLGPVNLIGGTLALAPTPTINGFNGFTLNKDTTTNKTYTGVSLDSANQVLTLTDNAIQEGTSAFSPRKNFSSTGFTAGYTYRSTGGADGIAFVIQNDARGTAAIGGPGGGLGYSNNTSGTYTYTAIGSSVAVAFNIFNGTGTALLINGQTSAFTATSPVDLRSSDPIDVRLNYNAPAGTLAQTLTDTVNGNTFTTTYAGIGLSSLLGSNSGYVGFTGGSGDGISIQTVSNFFLNTGTASPTSIPNPVNAITGTSAIQVAATPAATSAAVGAINVSAGATLKISSSTANRAVLSAPSIMVAASGTVDVTTNDLVITGSSIDAITALIKTGRISSSTAAADSDHLTAVGVIGNEQDGSPIYTSTRLFDGAVVGSADVLVKFTYFGDANLDGKVDGADYSLIDNGYLAANSTGWFNGDSNYDGVTDGSDYSLIDNAYNRQTVGLSPTASVAAADVSATVPEPASMALAAFALTVGRVRVRSRAVV